MKLTGPEKLKLLARSMRRERDFKERKFKLKNSKLVWRQYDCRPELARLIAGKVRQASEDAPTEGEE